MSIKYHKLLYRAALLKRRRQFPMCDFFSEARAEIRSIFFATFYKKTVVYLQLITAKWHIENGKNDEWWYY